MQPTQNLVSEIQAEHWKVKWFQSGTMIVQNVNGPKEPYAYGISWLEPHFGIRGPGGETEAEQDRNRLQCCHDICDYLNDVKPRPAWLDDMERTDERSAVALDGTSIVAEGPSVDKKPPSCWWVLDESPEACNMRARLMDRLFLKKA